MEEGKRSRGKAALDHLDFRIREIRRTQVKFSFIVLSGIAVWYGVLVLAYRGDTAKANYVFTNSFQFLAVAWCCWFMLPYFLRVEAKQDVSIAMGHDSVDVLDKIDSSTEPKLEKFGQLLDRADKAFREIETGDHKLTKEFMDVVREARDHMVAIRKRVERDTTPLTVTRRPEEKKDPVPENGEGFVYVDGIGDRVEPG